MSEQKLKIKVKEIIEEKRPLNDAERKLYDIYQMEQNPLIIREINDYFDAEGFDHISYDGNEGTFKKEVIRDAIPHEEKAYLNDQLRIRDHYYPMSDGGIEETLKDKQILLEIEEGD